ncbi:WASH complex subunit 2 [Toxorhynchites rutilus septentrionalis]|uniref:WASH complex subunit 2 n=1 Tax=Toxorhynchites rutilus septentrionalis TaxID=329112 RepID=UPI00247A17C5|nr:WASH complex subunit 2 [Toxorhynchites rutilus septentrionalis]
MALTPDDLRKRIPQWSLESDGHLLQYMVQISKNLQEKCKQTQNNLNRLLFEVDESHIRFGNASNTFNGVQQLKFVENRVKDDDESFYSVRDEEVEKDEKSSYSEIFQMAVENSVANMYKCFEKVTVQLESDSDSDDDDEEAAARNTVLRAVQKYPYIDRPLPYIIGSQKWREKWHVGLIDSEEETDSDTKQQFSDSSDSEGMFPSQTNSNHTPSESEGSVWGVHTDPRKRASSNDPSVSGDDTLSIHSALSTPKLPAMRAMLPQYKVPVLPVQKMMPPPFSANNKTDDVLSVSSKSKTSNLFEDSDEDSTPIHKPSVQTTKPPPAFFRERIAERKSFDLFADEPPPIDRHEPIAVQQRKPVNLFIESDEEGDSLNNNLPSNVGSVYQGEPSTLSIDSKRAIKVESNEAKLDISVGKKPTTANIFDDVNNNNSDILEEDDLFVPAKRSINGGPDRIRKITNLFDDDPPVDDFDEIFKPKAGGRRTVDAQFATPPKTKPAEANEGSSQQNMGKKVNIFDREPDSQRSNEIDSTPVQRPVKTPINLFDDDDLEGIFAKDTPELDVGSKRVPEKSKINLFDDTDDEIRIPSSEIVSKELVSNETNGSNGARSDFSIRSEVLKKKTIFESDSDGDSENDSLFNSRTVLSRVPEPVQRKTSEDSQNPIIEHEVDLKVDSVEDSSNPEKNDVEYVEPQVSMEPPEIPPFEDQQQENMNVTNDIDYYLTSYEVSGSSKEISSSILIDSKSKLNGVPERCDGSPEKQPMEQTLLYEPYTLDAAVTPLETNDTCAVINHTSEEDVLPTVAMSIGNKPLLVEAKSALSYNSIGLFDDVPPSDDDFDEPRVSSTVDQNEDGLFAGRSSTASNGNASGASGNLYFFMDVDGPPPDDMASVEEHADRDEVDEKSNLAKIQDPSIKRISAIIEERQRNEINFEQTKPKPKPNKLNTKVNINVNALLPGARKIPPTPSNRQESESVTAPSIVTTTNRGDSVAETAEQKSESQTAAPDKLIGVTKGRARIQVKRKPSSRQHRRTNYENSKTADFAHDNQSISAEKAPAEEVRVVLGSEVRVQHEEIIAAPPRVDHLFPIVVENNPGQFLSSDPIPSEAIPKAKGLFSEEESDGDDLFGRKGANIATNVQSVVATTRQNPKSTNPRPTVNSHSIFTDSDDDDDDLFSNNNSQPKTLGQSSIQATRKTSIVEKKSIFGSDEDSDGELFSATKKKNTDRVQNSSKPFDAVKQKTARAVTSTNSLFGDDEDDDDDDLFRSNKKQLANSKPAQTSGNKSIGKNYAKSNVSTQDDPLADLLGSS